MDSETIRSLMVQAKKFANASLNEAQTKTALVLPFISALGYNISDPFEVSAEYVADVGTKRGEKIDYAVLQDNAPVLLIECKARGTVLDDGKCAQLRRYFNAVSSAKVGILTNGTQYLFFSDRARENIMDDNPFMEIDLLAFNEQLTSELTRICKDTLDIDGLLSSADKLGYFRDMMRAFSEELANPSDNFIRYFASCAYQKKITAKALAELAPIFRQVIDGYIDDKINQRLESSKQSPKALNTKIKRIDDLNPAVILGNVQENGIETTQEEVEGYYIIKSILHTVIDTERLYARDAISYCTILLDDHRSRIICRLYFNDPARLQIEIFDSKKQSTKHRLEKVSDIYNFADKIKGVARSYGV